MSESLQAIAVPAFEDNYIWLLHNQTHAIVIDPGDSAPVLSTLQALHLKLQAILITHHHHDHVDGVSNLQTFFPDVSIFAPDFPYNFTFEVVSERSSLQIPLGDEKNLLHFSVFEAPGHTLDHVAYVLNIADETWLFCGDTLFGAGCGRLFEGTPAQMLASLKKLCTLPKETKVFCTHEYTLTNIAFALTLEPHNTALLERHNATKLLRQNNLPTLPSTLALEFATNPFLRCHTLAIKQAMGDENATELQVFSQIRALRNHF